jgi:hypothetical protein
MPSAVDMVTIAADDTRGQYMSLICGLLHMRCNWSQRTHDACGNSKFMRQLAMT